MVRNAGNKAQLRPAGAGALPELGNNEHGITQALLCFNLFYINIRFFKILFTGLVF